MTKTLALVGGAGGIGRALCSDAAERGWTVVVFDLPASLERHPTPDAAAHHPVDVTDISRLRTEMRKATDSVGAVSGAVLLAGFAGPSVPLADGDDQDWSSIIDGNLTGTRNAACAVAPHLADGGAMVLIGSGLGHYARPNYGPYAVAKAGVAAIGRQLALELAPRHRVNVVAPAAVDTAFLRGGTGRSDEAETPRIDIDAYVSNVPLGRVAEPEDVTGPILFLLSPEAGYITGQTLHVNGGAFMP